MATGDVSHPVFKTTEGFIRTLGRDTDATKKNWDKLIANVPIAPKLFGAGATPTKSPNIRRFHHRSFLSQRSRGFCTGWNWCGTLMTRLRIPQGATETTGDPLPLHRLSPLYTYDVGRWACDEDGFQMGGGDGLIGSQVSLGSKKRGFVPLENYDSSPSAIDRHRVGTRPGSDALAIGAQHLCVEFALARSFSDGLGLLAGGFPLAFASDIPSGMMQTDAKGFFRMKGSVVGGHMYQILDFDQSQNLIWVAQSWEHWGEKSDDPDFNLSGADNMHGYSQIGSCPLDEMEQWFSSSAMSSGSSEIMAPNTVQGFDPPIVDYSSMV